MVGVLRTLPRRISIDGKNMRIHTILLLLILNTGLLAQDPTDTEPLSLTVTPVVCSSPCTVVARAFVEPDEKNRSLTLIAESPEFRRASRKQLDGDRAARAHAIAFKNLEDGTYLISVRIKQSGGREIVREQIVNVKR